MFRVTIASGSVLLLLAGAFGQTPTAPAFEVATVKPTAPGMNGASIGLQPGGRFTTSNVTLHMLITFAWNLRDHQLNGGPGWLNSDAFDIVAKASEEIPQTNAGGEIVKAMVRSLLAERFKLVVHSETKELSIYALVLAKGGPKLVTAGPESVGSNIRGGRGTLTGVKVSTSQLAQQLASRLGRNVVDKTGLTGDYDFKLEWQPDAGEIMGKGGDKVPEPLAADGATGPSLFTAVQEQLGLKLEPQKGPVEILVIDHAEKPSNDN